MRILTVIGARPQYIKSAMLTKAIEKHNAGNPEIPIEQIVIHTGQHYDYSMHGSFFDQLQIPMPDIDLGIAGGGHGNMVGRMTIALEKEIQTFWLPVDYILVFGDTNSALAGALAASKLHIPVIHVEAGLRCRNKRVPEEINRILIDHVSDLLFCYGTDSGLNLMAEGIVKNVFMVGDISYDAFLKYCTARTLRKLPEKYCLATIHREENVFEEEKLINLLKAISQATDLPVIMPIHPNTKGKLTLANFFEPVNFNFIDPVSYFEMLALEKGAEIIVTDSGGVQKEAFWFGVPCITLRNETEELATIWGGGNVLVGNNPERIKNAFKDRTRFKPSEFYIEDYGNGTVAEQIVKEIVECDLH